MFVAAGIVIFIIWKLIKNGGSSSTDEATTTVTPANTTTPVEAFQENIE